MATPNVSSGYDYEFVYDPPKQLECPICLLTLRDVHVTSCCGSHYCQPCIKRVQNERKPCPLCNEPNFTTFLHKGLVREVNSLKIRCPLKTQGCGWEGELGYVERHLNPREGSMELGCGFVLVDCFYKCGEKVARAKIRNHLMEECPKRPVEVQVNSLARKMELMKVDFRKKLDAMTSESKEIKDENVAVKVQMGMMIAENKALKAEIRTLKRKVNQLQENSDLLDVRITPVPPFYFSLYNVEHYKENNLFWWSPNFYSDFKGYKMSFLLYPNGVGTEKGTHFSLYVAIVRGEFDNQLQWPFRGKIFLEVFNWITESWDHTTTMAFSNVQEKYNQRPSLERLSNEPLCFSTYLSHEWMHCFCKNGSMRFRVVDVKL